MTTTPQSSEPTVISPEDTTIGANLESGGELMPLLPPAEGTNDQWKEWGVQAKQILSELPDYIGQFFSDNKRPIITVGLIFAGFITLKLTLAVLDAINDIPLLSPTFELVGIGYTIWFVYRYLLQASTRQELSEEINSFKAEILGNNSQVS